MSFFVDSELHLSFSESFFDAWLAEEPVLATVPITQSQTLTAGTTTAAQSEVTTTASETSSTSLSSSSILSTSGGTSTALPSTSTPSSVSTKSTTLPMSTISSLSQSFISSSISNATIATTASGISSSISSSSSSFLSSTASASNNSSALSSSGSSAGRKREVEQQMSLSSASIATTGSSMAASGTPANASSLSSAPPRALLQVFFQVNASTLFDSNLGVSVIPVVDPGVATDDIPAFLPLSFDSSLAALSITAVGDTVASIHRGELHWTVSTVSDATECPSASDVAALANSTRPLEAARVTQTLRASQWPALQAILDSNATTVSQVTDVAAFCVAALLPPGGLLALTYELSRGHTRLLPMPAASPLSKVNLLSALGYALEPLPPTSAPMTTTEVTETSATQTTVLTTVTSSSSLSSSFSLSSSSPSSSSSSIPSSSLLPSSSLSLNLTSTTGSLMSNSTGATSSFSSPSIALNVTSATAPNSSAVSSFFSQVSNVSQTFSTPSVNFSTTFSSPSSTTPPGPLATPGPSVNDFFLVPATVDSAIAVQIINANQFWQFYSVQVPENALSVSIAIHSVNKTEQPLLKVAVSGRESFPESLQWEDADDSRASLTNGISFSFWEDRVNATQSEPGVGRDFLFTSAFAGEAYFRRSLLVKQLFDDSADLTARKITIAVREISPHRIQLAMGVTFNAVLRRASLRFPFLGGNSSRIIADEPLDINQPTPDASSQFLHSSHFRANILPFARQQFWVTLDADDPTLFAPDDVRMFSFDLTDLRSSAVDDGVDDLRSSALWPSIKVVAELWDVDSALSLERRSPHRWPLFPPELSSMSTSGTRQDDFSRYLLYRGETVFQRALGDAQCMRRVRQAMPSTQAIVESDSSPPSRQQVLLITVISESAMKPADYDAFYSAIGTLRVSYVTLRRLTVGERALFGLKLSDAGIVSLNVENDDNASSPPPPPLEHIGPGFARLQGVVALSPPIPEPFGNLKQVRRIQISARRVDELSSTVTNFTAGGWPLQTVVANFFDASECQLPFDDARRFDFSLRRSHLLFDTLPGNCDRSSIAYGNAPDAGLPREFFFSDVLDDRESPVDRQPLIFIQPHAFSEQLGNVSLRIDITVDDGVRNGFDALTDAPEPSFDVASDGSVAADSRVQSAASAAWTTLLFHLILLLLSVMCFVGMLISRCFCSQSDVVSKSEEGRSRRSTGAALVETFRRDTSAIDQSRRKSIVTDDLGVAEENENVSSLDSNEIELKSMAEENSSTAERLPQQRSCHPFAPFPALPGLLFVSVALSMLQLGLQWIFVAILPLQNALLVLMLNKRGGNPLRLAVAIVSVVSLALNVFILVIGGNFKDSLVVSGLRLVDNYADKSLSYAYTGYLLLFRVSACKAVCDFVFAVSALVRRHRDLELQRQTAEEKQRILPRKHVIDEKHRTDAENEKPSSPALRISANELAIDALAEYFQFLRWSWLRDILIGLVSLIAIVPHYLYDYPSMRGDFLIDMTVSSYSPYTFSFWVLGTALCYGVLIGAALLEMRAARAHFRRHPIGIEDASISDADNAEERSKSSPPAPRLGRAYGLGLICLVVAGAPFCILGWIEGISIGGSEGIGISLLLTLLVTLLTHIWGLVVFRLIVWARLHNARVRRMHQLIMLTLGKSSSALIYYLMFFIVSNMGFQEETLDAVGVNSQLAGQAASCGPEVQGTTVILLLVLGVPVKNLLSLVSGLLFRFVPPLRRLLRSVSSFRVIDEYGEEQFRSLLLGLALASAPSAAIIMAAISSLNYLMDSFVTRLSTVTVGDESLDQEEQSSDSVTFRSLEASRWALRRSSATLLLVSSLAALCFYPFGAIFLWTGTVSAYGPYDCSIWQATDAAVCPYPQTLFMSK